MSRAGQAIEPAGTQMAFRHGQLEITSPQALARLDRPALSVSTAQAMRGCPARFAAGKLVSQPPDLFSAAELGTAAHAVLERLYQLPASRRDRRAATRIVMALASEYRARHPDVLTEPVTSHRWSEEVTLRYSGIWDLEDPRDVHVTHTERRLDGEVAGVPFTGIIDRQELIEVKDGSGTGKLKSGMRLVDYKAGKVKKPGRFGDDHGDQLRIYAAAVAAAEGARPLQARVYYITHRQAVTVPLTGQVMTRTLKEFAAAWQSFRAYVERAAYPLKPSPLCGWCPLVAACPAAAAAGKADRTGQAPPASQLLIPGSAGSGPVPQLAPHLADDTKQARRGEDMSETARPWREAKPWEGDTVDGHLSLNSYAATAVFGLASWALELIDKAGIEKVSGALVQSVASLLAGITRDVQAKVTCGDSDWQSGASTRVRGALHSVLETMPMPFDSGDPAVWEAWRKAASARCLNVARLAISLFDDGPLPPAEAIAQVTARVANQGPKAA